MRLLTAYCVRKLDSLNRRPNVNLKNKHSMTFEGLKAKDHRQQCPTDRPNLTVAGIGTCYHPASPALQAVLDAAYCYRWLA